MLSSWVRVLLTLSIYTSIAIYAWLVFVIHLIYLILYITFSVLYFCFQGWRHHKNWQHLGNISLPISLNCMCRRAKGAAS